MNPEIQTVVRNRAPKPLARPMLDYLAELEEWPGVEHQARFDKGKGPTGVYTLLNGVAFAWLYPGHEPPVVHIHAGDAEAVAARHPGSFAGEKNTRGSRKNVVHVQIHDAGDLEVAKAVAVEVRGARLVATGDPVTGRPRGAFSHQAARAGEHFVAAELNRRGAYAVTFAGNMPNIDILASDAGLTRTVMIQVKTRRRGTWQSTTTRGRPLPEAPSDTKFWVFVDLPTPPTPPSFYVVPEDWIRHDIYTHHQDYLKKHGGKRGVNPDSTHHAIKLARIQQWRDRWDLLGIF